MELVHDITKGKWKPIIPWQLGKGEMLLSQPERDIKGVNQKMPLEQLKELLDFGAVEKESSAGYPLKVGYPLTERGHKPLGAIVTMQSIGIDLMKENGVFDVPKEQGFI